MKTTSRFAAATATLVMLCGAAAVAPVAQANDAPVTQAAVAGIPDNVSFVEMGDTINTWDEVMEASKKRMVILSIGRNFCGGCVATKGRLQKWAAEDNGSWIGVELNKDLAPVTAAAHSKDVFMVPFVQAIANGQRMMQPFPMTGPTEDDLRYMVNTAKAKYKPSQP